MDYWLYDGISLQNKRPSNMDSLLLKKRKIGGQNELLAVVCDGVGSMADGAFASGHAVRMLGEWFGALETVDRIGIRLRDNIFKINDHIVAAAKVNNLKSASTLSAMLLDGDTYYVVHIGDSRIYSFDGRSLSMLTNDDVSDSGKLTACIGQRKDIKLHYTEGRTMGKTFLLCSDGVYKRIDFNFLITKMSFNNKRNLRESIASITDFVIAQGERDNISLALVKTES